MKWFWLVLLPLTLCALDKEPWLGNLWEFELDTAYTYSRYSKVANAKKPLKHSSNDQLIYVDFAVSPTPNSQVDIDLELANTPRRPWGFQSSGIQYRTLWLDDVIGDPVSLTTGVSLRGVNHHSLQDVSCPYHSYLNAEINVSVGKETEAVPFWNTRTFLFAALGMANRGAPWARARLAFEKNDQDRHQWELFAEGYVGFGHHRSVDIGHFDGYASIRHRSLDLGSAYRHRFTIWGTISFEYACRIYARSFPEKVNFFTVRYQLPFSLF